MLSRLVSKAIFQIATIDLCFTKAWAWMFSASRWAIVLVQFALLNFTFYLAMLYAFINQIPSDAFLGVQFLKSCIIFFGLNLATPSVMAILFMFLGLLLPDSKRRVAARRSAIEIEQIRDQLINRIRNQHA